MNLHVIYIVHVHVHVCKSLF